MNPISLQYLRLDRGDDLGTAFVRLGLLSATPPVPAEAAASAETLRGAILRAAHAAAAGDAPALRDAQTLNSFASDEPPLPVLGTDGKVVRTAIDPARAALAAIARDAIETIGSGSGRLRRCERPGCTLVFLNATRGRRRRWCSMDRCGNREKVAAFRIRVRES